jgi:glycosyltransferase involved in cell wall biosynthesis
MKTLPKIVITTIMRKQGGSGLQSYINTFEQYALNSNFDVTTLTPFNYFNIATLPVFAVRRLIDPINGALSIWWYQYWHYYFLKRVLKRNLRKERNKQKKAVIYAQCPISAKAALESREKGQKVFMVVHFNISQADEWVGKGKIKLRGSLYKSIKEQEQEVISKLDGIVYVSQFMKNIIETNVPGAKHIKSICLPCFTSRPIFNNSNEYKGDMISIGTLESRKNQEYFLHVLAYAKKKGHTYTLTLVGDGPSRQSLEVLSRKLGVDKQITFLGYQQNGSQFLKNHRIYVHGALIENLPISLLEALAANLPIIAAPTGGIPEIVSEGEEGFYWPLDNPEKGAEVLSCLLENGELYKKMSKAAELKYLSKFESAKVVNQLTSFLCA